MKKIAFILTFAIMIFGAGVIGVFSGNPLLAGCQFNQEPLEDKSIQEIDAAARAYLCVNATIKGEPKLRLGQFITPDEYMSFFGGTGSLCKDQKLALFIYEGDFEYRLLGATGPIPTKFVSVLFDLKVGYPTRTSISGSGSEFQSILKDETLPKLDRELPSMRELLDCRYDQIAPTVEPNQ